MITAWRNQTTVLLAVWAAAFGWSAVAVQARPDVARVSGTEFARWVHENAVLFDTLDWRTVDLAKLSVLDKELEGKRVVYLGEPDHYIREKFDYRLIFIRYLVEKGWRHIGMEMGRSDSKRLDRYLQTGDMKYLDRVAAFGYQGDRDQDRRWTLRGLVGHENREFWERAWGERRWFLQQLRSLNEALPPGEQRLRWFGFDVDTRAGGGYVDAEELLAAHRSQPLVQEILRRMALVDGESPVEEIERLQGVLSFLQRNQAAVRVALGEVAAEELWRTVRCLTDGLEFLDSATEGLGSPRGLAGLRQREERMCRHMDEVLSDLPGDAKIILMGHNLHLSKNSYSLRSGRITWGGKTKWLSVGSHVAQKLPGEVFGVWMLFDHGRHGRLTGDRIVEEYVASNPYVLEHLLAKAGDALLLPLNTGDVREAFLDRPLHFLQNGRPASGIIGRQVDAIFFVAEAHQVGGRAAGNS